MEVTPFCLSVVVSFHRISSALTSRHHYHVTHTLSLALFFFLLHIRTGPAAQINFMGYARAGQTAHGIHQRLRARAFIIGQRMENTNHDVKETMKAEPIEMEEQKYKSYYWDTAALIQRHRNDLRNHNDMQHQHQQQRTKQYSDVLLDPNKTVCFVSIDAGMGSDLINMRVVQRLNEETNGTTTERSLQGLCRIDNLSISATHTHSAPAGFLQYALFQITSLGFSDEVFQAYTEGIVQAIRKAFHNIEPVEINVAQGLLFNVSINRSPTSYLLNPEEERLEYAAQGDTDKNMVQLTFTASQSGEKRGLLNWFAVHGTSMNASNQLISGDNKGYASYLSERYFNGNETLTGDGRFVAAFASTNLGDVSPNTVGPRCTDTGLPCDIVTSTCGGDCMKCVAQGPGRTDHHSTEIIGRKQYEHSLQLLQDTNKEQVKVVGPVAFRHSFVEMSNVTIWLKDGNITHTCPAALGYSFAGGTTDGPGDFPFHQGTNTSYPFWNMMGGFLSIPTAEEIYCQFPKPILLNVGKCVVPYSWDPNTIPISIFRIGHVFILNVPSEFTTMAGRRLRKAVQNVLESQNVMNTSIVIAGLANSYSHYVTTEQEYASQRYEAASTLYGKHTLTAYIQEFERITTDLLQNSPSESAASPPDLYDQQISLVPPVLLDTIGLGYRFGSVAIDAKDQYRTNETVGVSFRSSNPRNNQRIGGTFLTVDILSGIDGEWHTIYVDSDWCTQYRWKGGDGYLGVSFAEIHWNIPKETTTGLYRICHNGTRNTIIGVIEMSLDHIPGWMVSSLLGSYAINIVLQIARMALYLSHSLRRATTEKLAHFHYKDFHGCSRAFLVR